MYNIIALIIILSGLAVVLFIVIKKLPYLATFNVDEIPEEKAAETKEKIINERIQRKAKSIYAKIAPLGKLIHNLGQRKFKNISDRLKELEEKYKKKSKKELLVTKVEFDNLEKKIEAFLKDAEILVNKEDYLEAEKKYLEILTFDAKNTNAYHGLANLYFLQKSNEEAKQTYRHILKINKADSKAHFELAELCSKMNQLDEAVINIEKALEIEPNNPKYLDLFVVISIMMKDKDLAKEALKRLEDVNPENNKIVEFKQEIANL